jgi:hypothetical protein
MAVFSYPLLRDFGSSATPVELFPCMPYRPLAYFPSLKRAFGFCLRPRASRQSTTRGRLKLRQEEGCRFFTSLTTSSIALLLPFLRPIVLRFVAWSSSELGVRFYWNCTVLPTRRPPLWSRKPHWWSTFIILLSFQSSVLTRQGERIGT